MSRHAEQMSLYEGVQRQHGDTAFLGYETTTAEARVVDIIRDGTRYDELEAQGDIELRTEAEASAEVVLDQTPFYAEGGGQIGDRGELRLGGEDAELVFKVEDTQKPVGGLIVHRGKLHGASEGRRRGDGGRRRRPAGPHDAQPHRHALAPPGAPQRRRRPGPPGRLARHARLPAVRLPARSRPDRGRAPGRSRTRSAESSATTEPSRRR